MRDFAKIALGVIVAFLIRTAFSKISLSTDYLFNFLTLVVIYFAVARGEIFGTCLGAFCGLLQDSFSLGIFGVAGLAKTITGFLAGYISKKVDVIPLMQSFLFIFMLISLELVLWALLYSFIFSESVNTGGGLIFFQPLSTSLLGCVIFYGIRRLDKSEP